MRHTLVIITLGTVVLAGRAAAQQDTVPLVRGERIRVHQAGKHKLVGTLAAADSLQLTIITSPLDTIPVPRSAVTGIDRWAGTQSKTGEGALVGLGVGLVGGAIVGGIACGGTDYSMSTGSCIAAAAGIFGLIGAAGGAIIWSTWHTDRWEPTVWPTMTIQPLGSGGKNVSLGVRLRI
jgi:hypothetical protein